MLKRIFYTGFFVWIFLYILIYLKPELHFHAQQPAFLNTRYFFDQHLLYPGGISKYISESIMQGFYNNWLGSLIILVLASSLSFLLFKILNKLNLIKNTVFLFFPFSLAILLFNDYYFPLEILINSILIFLSVFSLLQLIKFNKTTIAYSLFLYAELYYLCGSGTALIFSLSALFALYLSAPIKVFIKLGIGLLVFSFLFPFLAYTFLFNISLTQAYFQFLPEVPVTLIYNHSFLLYFFLFLLPALLFFDGLLTKAYNSKIQFPAKLREMGTKINGLFQQLALYFFISGFMIFLMHITKNKHKRNIIQSDYYSYLGNWEKVIDIAHSDNEYDFGINMNYNRAIDNSGKFLQNFFDYPQLIGVSSLFPENLKTPFYAMQTSDFYLDINYISKSQHWAYAVLTIEPYNARVLKRLVITNLILGNYKASRTYLNVLDHNKLNSEFVNKYAPFIEDTTRIATDPYLSRKRALNPLNFAIPVNIKDRLLDLIARDSSNRQAFEYLQMCYLLEHDLGNFMNNYNESMKFYNQIPAVYEQAVLLYLYSSGQSKSRINISENTKNQFQLFLKILKQCNNDKEVAKSYLESLKNSYIYYVTYLSPKVTNIQIETKME